MESNSGSIPVYLYTRILSGVITAGKLFPAFLRDIRFTVVLTHYRLITQVAQLRERFFHSISPGGLAGDRRGVVPASGFSFSAQQIWKVIKENKDLDLPAHKVC